MPLRAGPAGSDRRLGGLSEGRTGLRDLDEGGDGLGPAVRRSPPRQLEGREVAFLPRHGRGHRLASNEINYSANIAALKAVGCDEILAVSAVGSFQEDLSPGTS